MYRERWTCEVKYGHFRDFFETVEEIERLREQRGWKHARSWLQVGGKDNCFVSEIDYDSLSEWEHETESFSKDKEIMDAVRRGAEHVVQGTSHTQMLMRAEQIA